MSTINPLALYQIETFGTGFRHARPQDRQMSGQSGPEASRQGVPAKETIMNRGQAPKRTTEFLVQLMVDGDSDLRKKIGRRDIAERREAAYGSAMANRPSARPLSFLRVIGSV